MIAELRPRANPWRAHSEQRRRPASAQRAHGIRASAPTSRRLVRRLLLPTHPHLHGPRRTRSPSYPPHRAGTRANQRASAHLNMCTTPAHMRMRICTPSEAIRCDQRPSEAVRGRQRPSEAVRSHQRPSEAIIGHQRPSEAIRGHQRVTIGQSDAIRALRKQSEGQGQQRRSHPARRRHQWSSQRRSSEALSPSQALSARSTWRSPTSAQRASRRSLAGT